MPTREDLMKYDLDELYIMLKWVLRQATTSYAAMHVLQDMYELVIVIVCKEAGLSYTSNDEAAKRFSGWNDFRVARNTLAHDLVMTDACSRQVKGVAKSGLLRDICGDLLGSKESSKLLVDALNNFDADEFKQSMIVGNEDYVVCHGHIVHVDIICKDLPPATVSYYDSRHQCADANKETWFEIHNM